MKKSEMNRETEKMSVKHESIQSFTNTSIPKNGDVDNDKQNKQANEQASKAQMISTEKKKHHRYENSSSYYIFSSIL